MIFAIFFSLIAAELTKFRPIILQEDYYIQMPVVLDIFFTLS